MQQIHDKYLLLCIAEFAGPKSNLYYTCKELFMFRSVNLKIRSIDTELFAAKLKKPLGNILPTMHDPCKQLHIHIPNSSNLQKFLAENPGFVLPPCATLEISMLFLSFPSIEKLFHSRSLETLHTLVLNNSLRLQNEHMKYLGHLQKIRICNAYNLTDVRDLRKVPHLSFYYCNNLGDSIGDLSHVRTLRIVDCSESISTQTIARLFRQPPNEQKEKDKEEKKEKKETKEKEPKENPDETFCTLQRLSVQSNYSFLEDVSHLRFLVTVSFYNCESLKDIGCLGKVGSKLQHLTIDHCFFLQTVAGIELAPLVSVSILHCPYFDCYHLQHFKDVRWKLTLDGCQLLRNHHIPYLSRIPHLVLMNCGSSALTDVSSLAAFGKVQDLTLANTGKISLKSLVSLWQIPSISFKSFCRHGNMAICASRFQIGTFECMGFDEEKNENCLYCEKYDFGEFNPETNQKMFF